MTRSKCELHGQKICSACTPVSDAAKRMRGIINDILAGTPDSHGLRNYWMAFRLSDGSSDGELYETRPAAISHQLHETQCAYFCFRNALGGVSGKECQVFLDLNRHAYDSGMRLSEPDAPQIILSTKGYDIMSRRIRG